MSARALASQYSPLKPSNLPTCALNVYTCEQCSRPNVALTPGKTGTCDGKIYFCKYTVYAQASGRDLSCQDSSLTNFACVHGGGIGCKQWRRLTNQSYREMREAKR